MTSPLAKSTIFVVLTYAVTWTCWSPLVFRASWLTSDIANGLLLAGALTPMLVAFCLWPWGAPLKLKTLFHWRIAWWTIPVSVLLVPVTVILVRSFFPPDLSLDPYFEMIPGTLFPFLMLIPIIFGEEFGWRGYLFPQLMQRFGFLSSALLVGLIWGLWHLPLFFMGFYPLIWGSIAISFGLIVWQMLCSSIYISWLYAESGYRILIPCLLHTSNNTFGPVALPNDASDSDRFFFSVIISSVATLFCLGIAWWVRRSPKRVQLPTE